MTAPDAYLMDRIVQPVVDRLPTGWSCFDVSHGAALAFGGSATAMLAGQMLLPVDTHQHLNPIWGCALMLGCVFTTITQMRRIKSARNRSRANCANAYRVDGKATGLMWLWVFCTIANVVGEVTGACGFDAGDIASVAAVASYATVRAQPRPPEQERKTWLPATPVVLGAQA